MKNINLYATVYDHLLEPSLKSLKRRVADFAKKYHSSAVLDLCSGTGMQCRMLGKKRIQTLGLDMDERMVSYARQKAPDIPFICADAGISPLKSGSISTIIISFALHDKPQALRTAIMLETKRLLSENGKIIIVDFENAWSKKSRWGYRLVYLIERMAGNEHFWNGRRFLKAGGLTGFLKEHNLTVIERYDSEKSCTAIVVAEWKNDE
ncbi:MAG: methyltransferase domain-containing protein [Actinobacteria bacterium]|nr:methyltransferase domain-containing protein [Actinomycetota bacterium]